VEPAQRIERSIHHREAEDRRAQLAGAEQRLLDGDLVVVVVDPPEELPQRFDLLRRIRLQLRAQRRLLGERQRLEGPRLEPVEHAARAIDIHAAERDHVPRPSARQLDQLARLRPGAEHEVDDDLRTERPQRVAALGEALAIAGDRHVRPVELGRSAVKDRELVAAPREVRREEPADETRAADEEDLHGATFASASSASVPVAMSWRRAR
jgi:hypothetical protein